MVLELPSSGGWSWTSEIIGVSTTLIVEITSRTSCMMSQHFSNWVTSSFNFGAFLSFDFQIKEYEPNMNWEFSFSVGVLSDSCCIQWKESSLGPARSRMSLSSSFSSRGRFRGRQKAVSRESPANWLHCNSLLPESRGQPEYAVSKTFLWRPGQDRHLW